jgi:hypothetical protein
VQHFKLTIAADLQERSSHSSYLGQRNSAVQVQNLSLSVDFLEPLIFGELFAEAVTVD